MPEITLSTTITADGTYSIPIRRAAYYRVQVGINKYQNFGGGNVSAVQDGLTYSDIDAVTVVAGGNLLLKAGMLDFVVASSTSPSLRVSVQEVHTSPSSS